VIHNRAGLCLASADSIVIQVQNTHDVQFRRMWETPLRQTYSYAAEVLRTLFFFTPNPILHGKFSVRLRYYHAASYPIPVW